MGDHDGSRTNWLTNSAGGSLSDVPADARAESPLLEGYILLPVVDDAPDPPSGDLASTDSATAAKLDRLQQEYSELRVRYKTLARTLQRTAQQRDAAIDTILTLNDALEDASAQLADLTGVLGMRLQEYRTAAGHLGAVAAVEASEPDAGQRSQPLLPAIRDREDLVAGLPMGSEPTNLIIERQSERPHE